MLLQTLMCFSKEAFQNTLSVSQTNYTFRRQGLNRMQSYVDGIKKSFQFSPSLEISYPLNFLMIQADKSRVTLFLARTPFLMRNLNLSRLS